jgi:tRNA nucleotidyltransferase (CCA-adding enzyme)
MKRSLQSLIPPELARILVETPELRESFLVGGCVRDALLGIENKDFDIEVFGLNYEELVRGLSRWGRTDLVGKSFGVVKLTTRQGATFDFSIPRRDSKVAPGHKGFTVTWDPAITPRDAAARRDFTFNALMYDPRRDEVLDFLGGVADLENRVLRHASPAFVEDPLRVLRGMQFAARFDLEPAPETVALCRQTKASFRELAVERVGEEWFKWAARSTRPSAGLRFLEATEWIEHFPEIEAVVGVPQDPEWHPEGDVWKHTGHCCDALVTLPEWQQANSAGRIVYSLAVLTHDLGKARTTQQVEQEGVVRITSPRHEDASVAMAESFLRRIRAPNAVIERVLPLVKNHMVHVQTVTDRAVRRLARRLEPETITSLCTVMTADAMGRPPKPPTAPPVVTRLRARATELAVHDSAPKPILMGRHLLELGMEPGPELGEIVEAAYEAQLEGEFSDLPQALRWLSTQAEAALPPVAREALSSKLKA